MIKSRGREGKVVLGADGLLAEEASPGNSSCGSSRKGSVDEYSNEGCPECVYKLMC